MNPRRRLRRVTGVLGAGAGDEATRPPQPPLIAGRRILETPTADHDGVDGVTIPPRHSDSSTCVDPRLRVSAGFRPASPDTGSTGAPLMSPHRAAPGQRHGRLKCPVSEVCLLACTA